MTAKRIYKVLRAKYGINYRNFGVKYRRSEEIQDFLAKNHRIHNLKRTKDYILYMEGCLKRDSIKHVVYAERELFNPILHTV